MELAFRNAESGVYKKIFKKFIETDPENALFDDEEDAIDNLLTTKKGVNFQNYSKNI